MELLQKYMYAIIGVTVVLIALKFGLKELEQRKGKRTWVGWVVFTVRAGLGLILGYALSGIVGWLTGLSGPGAILGSLGAIISLALGWHAILMLVGLVVDVADGKPDKDAMTGALWIPTLLPAGFTAAWQMIGKTLSSPPSVGLGLVAAIMALHGIVYCFMINKKALKRPESPKHKYWKWFCVPVSLIGGLIAAAFVAYLDEALSNYVSPSIMLALRVIGGVVGIAFGLRALADIADGQPDRHVRAALLLGLPLVYLLGSGAIAWLSSSATSGFDKIPGVSA